jgi:hypothetical protein
MQRVWLNVIAAAFVCALPAWSAAQVRTTGQIVGTVKDASGAIIQKASLVVVDTATGTTQETTSGPDGGFVFPNLQPGTYTLTATAARFQPLTLQKLAVQTGRSTDVVVQFELAGVTEQVSVVGRTSVVETTSTTVSNTVRSEQIEKLPLAGRNLLDFALLVPGTATSAGSRFSEFNGLPGAAINITLDGINNNSQRFRSGGTSFFVFAPVRMGAIEEVTVSTAGLTADAGAEGAVQVQFVTKRGANMFRGQVFDQYSSEKLNAIDWVDEARGFPKLKSRRHEWGANVGGPIVENKLFFFGNFEQIHQPGESTQSRTILTDEAQRGIFRYVATDGSTRTVDLLGMAAAAGFQGTVDPYVASQFQIINGVLNRGTVGPEDLVRNEFTFVDPNTPNVNIYPTARIDYQARPNLAIRGILNLHWRDLITRPQYPGLPDFSNGFTSTYYILSTGYDWTLGPNLFNQMSFGVQSNFEEFNPGNTLAVYDGSGGRRIGLPLMTSPQITGDVMPIPRNNPVYNVSNTFTWLRGRHTWTAGGTFRRTTMYETIGGAPPLVSLGVVTDDPAANVFTTSTIPGLRSEDRGTALSLYALLTGRISGISGTYALNEDTREYGVIGALRREAQNVGGLYIQDQWRVNPTLTVNYGLRWEFSGAAYNTNDVYSSVPPEQLLGPSSAPFQPGALTGVSNPVFELRPKPYERDFVNPAPNVGITWAPERPSGVLGSILGRSVYRASFGVNYYDEGLINFQTAAGNGPGLTQTVTLSPGMPGFTAGGLTLQSALPPFRVNPTSFSFPVDQSLFTFTNRTFATIDPDIETPYVNNWSIGYQRELWRDAAIEVRYVGNRGHKLWRSYDFNEVNIVENGFLEEFRNAQRNLQINQANGLAGFRNNGLPGQTALPIFDAAFGPRGRLGAVAAGSGYSSNTFIQNLEQGQAGRFAQTLGTTNTYLCRMMGSAIPACAGLTGEAPNALDLNFFHANPFAVPNAVRMLTDEASSKYDSLQLQFRQRYGRGFSLTANYTYGKARTDRFADSASSVVDYTTLRDKSLNWGPTVYDVRHIFQSYWTYEIPVGSGRRVNIDNAVLDQVFGGWALNGIVRMQSGRPFLLTSGRQTVNQRDSGVILRIPLDELQKKVNVRPGPNGNVYFLDADVIGPDGRANPDYIGFPTTPGEFGQIVYLYGPGRWTVDLGMAKMFRLPSDTTFFFEVLAINAFNTRNTNVGGTGGASLSINSTTFGQTDNTAAGPRQVQLRMRYNW